MERGRGSGGVGGRGPLGAGEGGWGPNGERHHNAPSETTVIPLCDKPPRRDVPTAPPNGPGPPPAPPRIVLLEPAVRAEANVP